MGCDIHLFVEKYDDNSSEWIKINKGLDDGYSHDGDCPYSDRNYALFSFLADVRNTSDGEFRINPYKEIKGLPENVSQEIGKESDEWSCDGHSHSYYTLKELKEARDIAKKTTYKDNGVVDFIDYLIFKSKGKPQNCSGGVWGGNVNVISSEEMEKLISRYNLLSKQEFINNVIDKTYTNIEWYSNLYESTKTFFDSVIPQLEKFSTDEDDIRIVFWFDN